MDPATIAASVVALVAPYLKKAAEAFAGEAGDYVQEKAKQLWHKLRSKLEGDPAAKETLVQFESDPEAQHESFQAKIEEKVARDQALGKELSAELTEIKRVAPYVRVVQKMKEAEELVGVRAKRLKRGTVDVTQEADKVTKATGGEFDDIG